MTALNLLPPETAHDLALFAARHRLVPDYRTHNVAATLFGKQLPSLFGLPGGIDKNAAGLAGWQKMGVGFVECGTILWEPHRGNIGPTRLWRQRKQQSLFNWIGLKSHGCKTVTHNIRRFRNRPQGDDFCIGANIATLDNNPADLLRLTMHLAGVVDFFVINISCPNVNGHKSRTIEQELTNIDHQIDAAQRGAGTRPVLLKLRPEGDHDLLAATTEHTLRRGVEGFVVCNGAGGDHAHVLATAIRDGFWPTHDGQRVGSYTGPGLFDIAHGMTSTIRTVGGPKPVIIGVGGIATATQGQKILDAGANLVAGFTALTYQGPRLVREMNRTLKPPSWQNDQCAVSR